MRSRPHCWLLIFLQTFTIHFLQPHAKLPVSTIIAACQLQIMNLGFVTFKLIELVFEEYIESCETSVNTCDVLLQINLFLIRKHFMSIDLLLHYPKPVPQHYNLVEEHVYFDFLLLKRLVAWLKYHDTILPAIS